jgi:hypothetical protein
MAKKTTIALNHLKKHGIDVDKPLKDVETLKSGSVLAQPSYNTIELYVVDAIDPSKPSKQEGSPIGIGNYVDGRVSLYKHTIKVEIEDIWGGFEIYKRKPATLTRQSNANFLHAEDEREWKYGDVYEITEAQKDLWQVSRAILKAEENDPIQLKQKQSVEIHLETILQ